jgi:hypothetical protein
VTIYSRKTSKSRAQRRPGVDNWTRRPVGSQTAAQQPTLPALEEGARLERDWNDLLLRDYRPRSTLHLAVHEVPRASAPVVDVHNHLGRQSDVFRHSGKLIFASARLTMSTFPTPRATRPKRGVGPFPVSTSPRTYWSTSTLQMRAGSSRLYVEPEWRSAPLRSSFQVAKHCQHPAVIAGGRW